MYEEEARITAAAIRKFAENPEKLDGFECYLTRHFKAWLEKYANTPEKFAEELENFSGLND